MTANGQNDSVKVAVVDDDRRVAHTIAGHLRKLKCEVRVFTDPEECLSALRSESADILITDLDMPGMDGLALMKRVKESKSSTDIIVVTGHADKTNAIRALKIGAYDFFEKPVDATELTETVKRTMRYRAVVRERDRLSDQLSFISQAEAKRWGIDDFVGKSKAVQKILWDVRLLQHAENTCVLVMGESGTGKELVARAIHFGGPRAARPFIPVNCSAIPPDLAESTLFGHKKGAFTGATSDRKGSFEMAHQGTLFLDEIGDMPLLVQTKLLRVIEDGVVVPVGATHGERVDVRIIAATNADLKAKISSGAFRTDLFYRLAGFTFEVPPLRDRIGDIPLLAEHFVRALSSEMGLGAPRVSPDALEAMKEHPFPGNVRELKNLVERALIESCGETITPEHLHFLSLQEVPSQRPTTYATTDVPSELPLNLKEAEALVVKRAMGVADGNVSEAARLLGVSRTKMYRLLGAADK